MSFYVKPEWRGYDLVIGGEVVGEVRRVKVNGSVRWGVVVLGELFGYGVPLVGGAVNDIDDVMARVLAELVGLVGGGGGYCP